MKWYTTKELARRLHCSHRTVQGWRVRGTGPAYHIVGPGRLRLYSEDDVEAFLQRRRSTSDEGQGRRP